MLRERGNLQASRPLVQKALHGGGGRGPSLSFAEKRKGLTGKGVHAGSPCGSVWGVGGGKRFLRKCGAREDGEVAKILRKESSVPGEVDADQENGEKEVSNLSKASLGVEQGQIRGQLGLGKFCSATRKRGSKKTKLGFQKVRNFGDGRRSNALIVAGEPSRKVQNIRGGETMHSHEK